jgi:hypothetical protein
LEPKLVAGQFDQNGNAALVTRFAGQELEIIYHNRERLDYGAYRIHSAHLEGHVIDCSDSSLIIPRSRLTLLEPGRIHRIGIELSNETKNA